MRLRTALAAVAAFVVISAVVSAAGGSRLAGEAGRASDPSASLERAHSAALSSREPEVEEEYILPTPEGRSSAAGAPERVVREFALAWINRPENKAELGAQNQRLVSLSRGYLANQVGAMLTAPAGSGSRGTVVGIQVLRRTERSAVVLMTSREQLAPRGRPAEPYHYGLYLARLERANGGFAVSSWEPQF